MAFDAVVDGLVAVGLVAVAAPVLVVFFREVGAELVGAFARATVALVAVGVGLTVPDPNVPELMIYVSTARIADSVEHANAMLEAALARPGRGTHLLHQWGRRITRSLARC